MRNKKAITLPPQNLFPPQQAAWQTQVAQQPVQQRGRPAGSTGSQQMPSQVMGQAQPSVATQLVPAQQSKGFGNTPMPAQKEQTMTPTAKSASLGGLAAQFRVQLNSEKQSGLISTPGTGLAAGLGALSAPQGHGGEGALRGMGRAGGLFTGAGLGAGVGALGGLGLGGLVGGLGGLVTGAHPHDVARLATQGADLGGMVGAGGGGLYGAIKGYDTAGKYMGEASYKKKHKDKPKKEEKKEKKAFIDTMAQGAGLEGARALSQGQSPDIVKRRSLRGLLHGPLGMLGMALGGTAGTLAGGGLGALGGVGLGALTRNPGIGATGVLAGAGLGGAAGMYYGGKTLGRAGYNLFREGKETDMAKGEEKKHKGGGGDKDKPDRG